MQWLNRLVIIGTLVTCAGGTSVVHAQQWGGGDRAALVVMQPVGFERVQRYVESVGYAEAERSVELYGYLHSRVGIAFFKFNSYF